MKQLVPVLCLLFLCLSLPAFAGERFLIEFKSGKPVAGRETVNLRDLIEHRARGYEGQRITEIIVHATPRDLGYPAYVQLFDDHRRQISQAPLANGYASLPLYEGSQRPAFLFFDNAVLLNRIEVIAERQLRAQKQKEVEIRLPKQVVEIGSFTKANYQSEVRKFSLSGGGGYSAINFRVHIGEQHAVIVNSILVLANNSKVGWKTVGTRLSSGDNEFSLDVPEGATDIQVSFAHGQGSSVEVFLLP